MKWPPQWADIDISVKELFPIVVAAAIWGKGWRQTQVCFHTDNMAVVAMLQNKSARDQVARHLLRCLYFYSSLSRTRAWGINLVADALSRDNVSLFSSLLPQARPTVISAAVSDLLLARTPDWGSPQWIELHFPLCSTGHTGRVQISLRAFLFILQTHRGTTISTSSGHTDAHTLRKGGCHMLPSGPTLVGLGSHKSPQASPILTFPPSHNYSTFFVGSSDFTPLLVSIVYQSLQRSCSSYAQPGQIPKRVAVSTAPCGGRPVVWGFSGSCGQGSSPAPRSPTFRITC